MQLPSNARLDHMLDYHVARTPNRVAWCDEEGQEYTYAEMHDAVDAASQWMRDEGVVPGDRVMLVAENCFEFFTAIFATWRLDAWIMPVNARLSEGEIERLASHAEPKLTLFTTRISDSARAHADDSAAKPCSLGHFGIDPNSKAEPVVADNALQVAALMYTTGTTGNPKGVMLSHASLLWYADLATSFRGLTANDYTYCALPVTHIYGLGSALLGTLQSGTCLEFTAKFSPEAMLDAINRGATVIPAVPAMYAHLLDHAASLGLTNLHNTSLRYLMTGGAPLDPDWKSRVEEFLNLPLHNGYGMTECAPGIASSRKMELSTSADDISCGQPLPGLDVQVVPAPDREELDDGVGEIIVKGPNLMLGYYKNPQETKAVMDSQGFFHTGDLGRFDSQGRLHIVGRSKELIIRSGFNVYPPEVEAALSLHPDVTLAAVVGRTLQGGNEEVLAFVQKTAGSEPSEDGLKEAISHQLAPYKRPSRIIITAQLPASSTGKILKSKLIETFQDQL